jgi:hypothetical protein
VGIKRQCSRDGGNVLSARREEGGQGLGLRAPSADNKTDKTDTMPTIEQ